MQTSREQSNKKHNTKHEIEYDDVIQMVRHQYDRFLDYIDSMTMSDALNAIPNPTQLQKDIIEDPIEDLIKIRRKYDIMNRQFDNNEEQRKHEMALKDKELELKDKEIELAKMKLDKTIAKLNAIKLKKGIV